MVRLPPVRVFTRLSTLPSLSLSVCHLNFVELYLGFNVSHYRVCLSMFIGESACLSLRPILSLSVFVRRLLFHVYHIQCISLCCLLIRPSDNHLYLSHNLFLLCLSLSLSH